MDVNLDVTLHNVVCCFHTKCHIKLKDFCLKARNVEYIREHGMVRLRLRKPATTSSIWASGKISVTGAKSENEAKQAARRVARILQRAGYDIKIYNYRVVNILAKCTLPFEVRLDAFAGANRDVGAQYEPELHPAVLVSIQNPKAVLHVFSTGSVTITTASVNNLSAALGFLYPLVVQHKVMPSSLPPPVTSSIHPLPPNSMPISHMPSAINHQLNGKSYYNGMPRNPALVKSEYHAVSRQYGARFQTMVGVDDIEEEEGGLNGDQIAHHCNFPRGASIVRQQPVGDSHYYNGDRRGLKRRMSCEESLGPADDLTSEESEGS